MVKGNNNVLALAGAFSLLIGACTVVDGWAQGSPPPAAEPQIVYLPQGWSTANRDAFYSTSQGSRIMPYSWFQALKHPDGQPLLADGLARYGYLPNPGSPQRLPVGFTLDTRDAAQAYIGMTCAACHTRQIEVGSKEYRIDGGPAIVDFERLLRDIQASVRTVLAGTDTSPAFDGFAKSVLGSGDTPDARRKLRLQVAQWFAGFDALLDTALIGPDWGLSRIDAIGMIFNRVTGLDLDLWSNIRPANAPVRYPFLWNASRQDKTQWPGFVSNGLDVLALGRNTGEVFGVFGWFHPTAQTPAYPDGTPRAEYLRGSSPDFAGLQALETDIRGLYPPKWPDGWPVQADLQTRGRQVFAQNCASCHAEQAATIPGTWITPVRNVGTDPKEWNNLETDTAETGALAGTRQPPLVGVKLAESDTDGNVLSNAVVGTILEDLEKNGGQRDSDGVWQAVGGDIHRSPQDDMNAVTLAGTSAGLARHLKDLFHPPLKEPGAAYEARVLYGIWAAAPYLHNGSVPSLAELLKPASQRIRLFKIGPRYDVNAVGLAFDQGPFSSTYTVGDCTGVSGNGNCGHEYGTNLSPADKQALLEFLKTY